MRFFFCYSEKGKQTYSIGTRIEQWRGLMFPVRYELKSIFIEAITLCLLLNEQHVFSRKHHMFNVLLIVHRDISVFYNMNQQDALFTFNLFQKLASTCFEHAYCSSSGGKNSVCTAIVICHAFMLPNASQHKGMTYTNCCT